MKKNKINLPTKRNSERFDLLFPMIKSDLNEIRELSKRKQDEPLNAFKVRTVNKKLEEIKLILAEQPTVEFLELLDTDTLPTNSDAVLLVSQYINAMEIFLETYFTNDGGEGNNWSFNKFWKTKD